MLSNVASYFLYVFFRPNSILHSCLSSFPNVLLFLSGSSTRYTNVHTFAFIAAICEPEAINMTRDLPNDAALTLLGGVSGDILRLKLASQMFLRCTRSEKHSKWHCSGDQKRINNDGRIIKLNINNIIKVSATANSINNNKLIVRLRSFRQVTGLPRCVDQLSDR